MHCAASRQAFGLHLCHHCEPDVGSKSSQAGQASSHLRCLSHIRRVFCWRHIQPSGCASHHTPRGGFCAGFSRMSMLSHLVKGERGAWVRGDPMGVAPGVARGVAPGVLRSLLRAAASCFPATLSGTRPCDIRQKCVMA